jgi:hypothetical protein
VLPNRVSEFGDVSEERAYAALQTGGAPAQKSRDHFIDVGSNHAKNEVDKSESDDHLDNRRAEHSSLPPPVKKRTGRVT